MAKGKISGFLLAVVLAVVSFFIIFLLFPDTADRYFGVSIKHNSEEVQEIIRDVQSQVEASTRTVVDKTISTVVDSSQTFINNVINGTSGNTGSESSSGTGSTTDYSDLISR
ncbi:MAG: hypothetical protein K6F82_02010 [Sphaerochaetaceae bacterium]|nr:hypothetical protein [Sphaerochaetaceae bacterium]